ncbi:MAG TPA: class II fructose-bisphosphate aldolase [Solirubrobacteraceae bacterium]|nr:class II fructose-bisphosphate aldolase [Solirubrobacteraceae bacterium]
MLASFGELLEHAARRRRAVGAFTVYDATTAAAVLHAAERRGRGVMLLVSSQTLASPIGRRFVVAVRALADDARAPCCLQLDHETDMAAIEHALELGFGAVMADGSRLATDANAAFVAQAVSAAERHGAHVEAELGRVSGDEEIAAAATRGALTDPAEAAQFISATGANCLAVSIGNVHGRYAAPPRLDVDRLAAIRQAVGVPLSLHGASGIPDGDVLTAIDGGIVKVNVNTELRDRYFDVIEAQVADLRAGARLLDLQVKLDQSLARAVERKLMLLDGTDQTAVSPPSTV